MVVQRDRPLEFVARFFRLPNIQVRAAECIVSRDKFGVYRGRFREGLDGIRRFGR
jgi:hypothetical protein